MVFGILGGFVGGGILGLPRGEATKQDAPAGEQPSAQPPAPQLPGLEEELPGLEPAKETPAVKPAKKPRAQEPTPKKPDIKPAEALPDLDPSTPPKTSSVKVRSAGRFGSEAYAAEPTQPVDAARRSGRR